MTNVKRVLIVDDDEILRGGMRSVLEGIGFVVDEAANGQEAKRVLMTKEFFLVVSDVEMPVMNGLELLEFVRQLGTGLRFLAVAKSTSRLQARQVLQLGADGFLTKPFSKSDFSRAVDASLARGETLEGASLESEFVQVPLTDFTDGTNLKVDVYMRMSASKYLKMGHKGTTLDAARVKGYLGKGIRWFYLRKEDYASYVGFPIDPVAAANLERNVETQKKIRHTTQVAEALISQLAESGVEREKLEDASNVVMNAVEMISMNMSSLSLLESLNVLGSLPAHSIAVAIWSCLIARHVQWKGESTYFKLVVSAFFHDIGEKELPENVLNKPRFELTKEERKMVEGHTFRGRDILLSVRGMPEDVATVALQHHEMVSGGGFPYSLKAHEIHPFARLISVTDHFCEMLRLEPLDKKLELCDIFARMEDSSRDFDTTFLQALGDIVHSAGDAEFEGDTFAKRGLG